MTTRGLALLASVLFLLLCGVVLIGARRLGYLDRKRLDPPPLVFENHLLGAKKGDEVELRPMAARAPWHRLWVDHTDVAPTAAEGEVLQIFHPCVVVGVAERRPREEHFYPGQGTTIPLRRMGAMSSNEWLEEIRTVVEAGENGAQRPLVRVTYGVPAGGRDVYDYDPAHPVGFLGWFRHQAFGAAGPPQVVYASVPR